MEALFNTIRPPCLQGMGRVRLLVFLLTEPQVLVLVLLAHSALGRTIRATPLWLLLATCHLSVLLHDSCNTVVVVTCHLPLITYHLPPATYHLPLATYHLPLATYHVPLTTYHLPLATYHLPPATYHLPLTTCHLPLITYH